MVNGSYLDGTVVLLVQLLQNGPVKAIKTGRIGVFLLVAQEEWLGPQARKCGSAETLKRMQAFQRQGVRVIWRVYFSLAELPSSLLYS